MQYFHDAPNRILYAVPDRPNVHPKLGPKRRGTAVRETVGWTISAQIEVTRADNYRDAKGNWRFLPTQLLQDSYSAVQDTEERAIGWFRASKMNMPGEPIDEAEYNRLKAEYEATARGNKPPK